MSKIIPNKLSKDKEILDLLLDVHDLSAKLHKLVTHQEIGDKLGVSKQDITYQSKKKKERSHA